MLSISSFKNVLLSTGLAFSSGLGATTTIMMMLKSGDHVIVMDDVYGGNNFSSIYKNIIFSLLSSSIFDGIIP